MRVSKFVEKYDINVFAFDENMELYNAGFCDIHIDDKQVFIGTREEVMQFIQIYFSFSFFQRKNIIYALDCDSDDGVLMLFKNQEECADVFKSIQKRLDINREVVSEDDIKQVFLKPIIRHIKENGLKPPFKKLLKAVIDCANEDEHEKYLDIIKRKKVYKLLYNFNATIKDDEIDVEQFAAVNNINDKSSEERNDGENDVVFLKCVPKVKDIDCSNPKERIAPGDLTSTAQSLLFEEEDESNVDDDTFGEVDDDVVFKHEPKIEHNDISYSNPQDFNQTITFEDVTSSAQIELTEEEKYSVVDQDSSDEEKDDNVTFNINIKNETDECVMVQSAAIENNEISYSNLEDVHQIFNLGRNSQIGLFEDDENTVNEDSSDEEGDDDVTFNINIKNEADEHVMVQSAVIEDNENVDGNVPSVSSSTKSNDNSINIFDFLEFINAFNTHKKSKLLKMKGKCDIAKIAENIPELDAHRNLYTKPAFNNYFNKEYVAATRRKNIGAVGVLHVMKEYLLDGRSVENFGGFPKAPTRPMNMYISETNGDEPNTFLSLVRKRQSFASGEIDKKPYFDKYIIESKEYVKKLKKYLSKNRDKLRQSHISHIENIICKKEKEIAKAALNDEPGPRRKKSKLEKKAAFDYFKDAKSDLYCTLSMEERNLKLRKKFEKLDPSAKKIYENIAAKNA